MKWITLFQGGYLWSHNGLFGIYANGITKTWKCDMKCEKALIGLACGLRVSEQHTANNIFKWT